MSRWHAVTFIASATGAMLFNLNARQDNTGSSIGIPQSRVSYSGGLSKSHRSQGGGIQVTHEASVHFDDPTGSIHLDNLRVRRLALQSD